MSDELRMNAYYYAFGPTEVREIDEILSAVACAGKAYHHTEDWCDETHPYGDHCIGESPAAWIQNAANRAANALKAKDAEIAALKERVGELTAPHGPLCSCRHCYSRQFQRAIEGE